MKRILVVGEDPLSCALGKQLVRELLPDWAMPLAPINTRGVSKLISELPRFIEQAKSFQPVLCIADTDRQCPVTLLQDWLPKKCSGNFILRLAVNEAESWLLADCSALAGFLAIPEKLVSRTPDFEIDPKRHLLGLAKKSKHRELRLEIVSATDSNKQGNGYNPHLCRFVQEHWSARRAADHSPSLARALRRISLLSQTTDSFARQP